MRDENLPFINIVWREHQDTVAKTQEEVVIWEAVSLTILFSVSLEVGGKTAEDSIGENSWSSWLAKLKWQITSPYIRV